MNRYLVIGFLFVSKFAQAQQEIGTVARKYFDKANEALQENRAKDADSLYTLSLQYGEFVGNYFNRALARKQLKNYEGFCSDMANASRFGDTVAIKLVLDSCGVNNIICFDSLYQPRLDGQCDFQLHVQGSKYFDRFFFTMTDEQGDTAEHYTIVDRDTIQFTTRFYSRPDFIGGGDAFLSLLQNELRSYLSGYAEIIYNVDSTGNVYNFRLLSFPTKFGNETLRVIRKYAHYKPAIKNGKPVKSTVMIRVRIRSINFNSFVLLDIFDY